jgi:dUTP pyrophosphatase
MSRNTFYIRIDANLPVEVQSKIRAMYSSRKNHQQDAGIDLFLYQDCTFRVNTCHLIDFGIQGVMFYNGQEISFQIRPRSSIFKSPLRLANSIGTIDVGYRGNLKSPFDCLQQSNFYYDNCQLKPKDPENYLSADGSISYATGKSFVQIVACNELPIDIQFVDTLNTTARGIGGFGSTGGFGPTNILE